METDSNGELRARAALPGMTVELLHRPATADRPEAMGVIITGMPNLPQDPLQLWMEAQRLAWAPWFALWGIALPSPTDRR